MDDDVFVIGVKRERRNDVPADWIGIVRGTPGITVMGDASPLRVQVRASVEAIAQIRDRLGDDVYVEKLIPHRTS